MDKYGAVSSAMVLTVLLWRQSSDALNNEASCQLEADHTEIHNIWMFF